MLSSHCLMVEGTGTAAYQAFSSAVNLSRFFSEWASRDHLDPEKGQSVISGSDVNCVTLPVSGVTLKCKQHSHFPSFLTSQLNSFAKVQNSSFSLTPDFILVRPWPTSLANSVAIIIPYSRLEIQQVII